jgi:hypothetical protein
MDLFGRPCLEFPYTLNIIGNCTIGLTPMSPAQYQ